MAGPGSSPEARAEGTAVLHEVGAGAGLLCIISPRGGGRIVCVADAACPESGKANAHVPAGFEEVRALTGGGSGVAVFHGQHPSLGSCVMKHGSHKDTAEVWSLTTIAKELAVRAKGSAEAAAAAARLTARIPEFRFIYVSTHHLVDRTEILWRLLRKNVFSIVGHMSPAPSAVSWSTRPPRTPGARPLEGRTFSGLSSGSPREAQSQGTSSPRSNPSPSPPASPKGSMHSHRQRQFIDTVSSYVRIKSSEAMAKAEAVPICLLSSNGSGQAIEVADARVDVHLGAKARLIKEGGGAEVGLSSCDGDEEVLTMDTFVAELQRLQEAKLWKVTVGQKTIGGAVPVTASAYLVTGRLHGSLLDGLLAGFACVLADLRAVTVSEERGAAAQVRDEVERLVADPDATALDVSAAANRFTGSAVHKNFDPRRGRVKLLVDFGAFAARCLAAPDRHHVLAEDEVVPAGFLARLLREGAILSDVFDIDPASPACFDGEVVVGVLHQEPRPWLRLLAQAVGVASPAALETLWTAGLTDAGLHNLFLEAGGEHHLWMFDLGEPGLHTPPGVLTKFLMSFFHVLGMVDAGPAWVRRFEAAPGGERLRMTSGTAEALQSATAAFTTAINHFVTHVFDGDPAVRRLLLRYVALQLVSDAAFCLERWHNKGGGAERLAGGTEGSLSKWLWRALWDIYVASYVHHTFGGTPC